MIQSPETGEGLPRRPMVQCLNVRTKLPSRCRLDRLRWQGTWCEELLTDSVRCEATWSEVVGLKQIGTRPVRLFDLDGGTFATGATA
jgi:hypothetical protein